MRLSPVTPQTALMAVLKQTMPHIIPSQIPQSELQQRELLGDILISSNVEWSEQVLQEIDNVYAAERNSVKDGEWARWTDLSSDAMLFHGTKLVIWNGDITKLDGIDAIVNAANEQGLGCFVPEHRCIDNTIHRAAGPRLRAACRVAMKQRENNKLLVAGSEPIVTDGYHLACKKVIHVTGPQVRGSLGRYDTELLAKAYRGVLDAAVQHGIKSVALCGISTGLFGFPKEEASKIAIATVLSWIKDNPSQLEGIVFDVFGNEDEVIYTQTLASLAPSFDMKTPITSAKKELELIVAKKWLDEADSVLICAGAGMSVKEGEMVYVKPEDFARHYPWFLKWGYKTSYEVMGLGSDPRVPITAKWALWSKHMDNQRWAFTPNQGYKTLLELVKDKDTFVLTSNVDGCFERSGFPKDRIYTPQGEWTYYQCTRACRPDAVFESRPMLDKVLPQISSNGFLPEKAVPKCPYCGGDVFGNVRADSKFIHKKYQSQNDALRAWMKKQIESDNKKVVVIEIGAGFNTPMVTRLPVESFVRELGEHRGRLIRINPSDAQVPSDLKAIALPHGWEILESIRNASAAVNKQDEARLAKLQALQGQMSGSEMVHRIRQGFGHFDWNRFLINLKD